MNQRLHFLDALRAFALIMMLQGHFISGLLDIEGVDTVHWSYRFWKYCRGFTAPIFFTITGWVFTHLLLKEEKKQGTNPRIRKGIRRSIELVFWGYLLRLNLPSLFYGHINSSFWQPDVLHIIGLGILFVLGIYLVLRTFPLLRAAIYLGFALLVFFIEPLYSGLDLSHWPSSMASYLVKGYGGVFYLFPWLGYIAIGSFLGHVYKVDHKNQRYTWGIGFMILGSLFIFYSSSWWITLYEWFAWDLMKSVAYNNYLFIRLGDALLLFGLFMLFEPWLKHPLWKQIGSNTLSIYIIHYFILYGSLSGKGLNKFYYKALDTPWAMLGAVLFVMSCVILAKWGPIAWKNVAQKARELFSV